MDEKLTLYYSMFCGYCRKVLAFIEEHDISVELKDINESSENRKELQEKGGKVQVPCLLIGDIPKYESEDIIAWLRENVVT